MHIHSYNDLDKNVMTFTQLAIHPTDGETYWCQVTKPIRYKITIPDEDDQESDDEYTMYDNPSVTYKYTWDVKSCATVLMDSGRDVGAQHIRRLFNKKSTALALMDVNVRLKRALVERVRKL